MASYLRAGHPDRLGYVRRARRLLAAAVAGLATGCAPDRPVRTPLDAFLESAACRDEVRGVLRELGAATSYIQAPPGADGAPSVRVPTARFAEWIAIARPPDAPPVLSHVTPDRVTHVRFGSECRREEREHAPTTSSDGRAPTTEEVPRFTDAELLALLGDAGGAPVVVYVWAPHMPLSPDGWPELQRAARSAGMRAVPVLMAHSDRAFATREAARVGMPDDGLREIASVELLQRQAQVHAPSIVVFGPDRVSPVLPGYRNAEGYLRYLRAFLSGG